MLNQEELLNYQMGHNDGVKHAEEELYQEFIGTLSDIKSGQLDIDHAIKEIANELAKRM